MEGTQWFPNPPLESRDGGESKTYKDKFQGHLFKIRWTDRGVSGLHPELIT
jgi:hypothetical protein